MLLTLDPEILDEPPRSRSRLPGEPHPFVPRVPPQHLLADGTIASGRSHEVTKGDPLLQRIRELEAEVVALRAELARP